MTKMSIGQGIREAMAELPKTAPAVRSVELPWNRQAPLPPGGPRPAARPRRVKPTRPIDELRRFWPDRQAQLITVGRETRDPEPVDGEAVEALWTYEAAGLAPREPALHAFIKPTKPAPRGPAEIVAYLARRGIELKASADGEFYAVAEAGRLDLAIRDAIEKARPLLRPFVHGTVPVCALPHSEPRPAAVTVLTGGALACEGCVR